MTELQKKEIQYVKGVGPRRALLLRGLGIESVMDLLLHYPRRYEDRRQIRRVSQLEEGQLETVRGSVLALGCRKLNRNLELFQIAVSDGSGVVYGTWFNQPYMKSHFAVGQEIILSGKVQLRKQLQIVSPEYELLTGREDDLLHTGRIVPFYPLTERLTQRTLRQIMHGCVERYAGCAPEMLTPSLRRELRLCSIEEALRGIHFPESPAALEDARRRLVFDEFLLMQLAIILKKKQLAELPGTPQIGGEGKLLRSFLNGLPFKFTMAQQRVLDQILGDMRASCPMNRLLQGDVGSGKTVVALAALLVACEAGYQSVLMAPTEILAEQHHRTMGEFLAHLDVECHLLVGEMSAAGKESVREAITSGAPAIVVGTHAVFQDEVEFPRLGLVIVDEQHRFGVSQRARLRSKGRNPDFMVMTATPIPRTLALTLYGDMDISVLDEMPPGRGRVTTHWVPQSKIEKAYRFIRREVIEGKQAYIVYPLIEESEKLPLSAASEMAERLKREQFPDLKVALLHGRMGRDERETIMGAFRRGDVQVLVATSIIEVGLDVPNACIMLVEHAERFGLSQLHQMRGRIGRGRVRSYFFFSGIPVSEEGKKRFEVLRTTSDGFRIAEMDLAIRGPGEFFSARQHGGGDFRIGDIRRDDKLLETARRVAAAIVEEDRMLKTEKHAVIRKELIRAYEGKFLLGVTG